MMFQGLLGSMSNNLKELGLTQNQETTTLQNTTTFDLLELTLEKDLHELKAVSPIYIHKFSHSYLNELLLYPLIKKPLSNFRNTQHNHHLKKMKKAHPLLPTN